MTSGAGERAVATPPRSGGVRRAGFTIVEVLMVVAVIAILFTLIMVASTSLRRKANREATRALIGKIRDALEDYKQATGSYPPDGFDSEVKNSQGTPIWGSACLHEFLCHERTSEEVVGGQVRRVTHPPLLVFAAREMKEHAEFPGAFEITDGFGFALHYDNTENGQYDPLKQSEQPHLEAEEDHAPDPRDDPAAVRTHGRPQRQGAYDLWSHGSPNGHALDGDARDVIATWNLDVEEAGSGGKKEEGS